MRGTCRKVLKAVSVAALVVAVLAGCGGSGRPQRSAVHGVPRALAQAWEGRASAIAEAASAGNGCRAKQLANALRTDVIAKEHDLPGRLRSPLLSGVNSLADGITCTPPPVTVTTPTKPPKPPHKPSPPHHPPGRHDHGKPGGDQGGDG